MPTKSEHQQINVKWGDAVLLLRSSDGVDGDRYLDDLGEPRTMLVLPWVYLSWSPEIGSQRAVIMVGPIPSEPVEAACLQGPGQPHGIRDYPSSSF